MSVWGARQALQQTEQDISNQLNEQREREQRWKEEKLWTRE